MRWTCVAFGLTIALAACGKSKPPTSPTSTTPGSTGGPTITIDVKADAAGSRDAVASLSEVIVDVSASTGAGLTYAIDFGDGVIATTATARHVYAAASTYTITGTVIDSQNRKATVTKPIAVREATGSWFQAGYVDRTKRVEVRRLSIDAQTGTTVRGTYRVTGNADRIVTGTLIPPRDIRMTASDGVSLIGTLPGRLNDDAVLWTLIAGGDSADGQRLDFHTVPGEPGGAPPEAAMSVRIGNDEWAALIAATPVRIDGTASRGTDLSYFIEFGDGFVAATSDATHVPVLTLSSYEFPTLPARLTVVDRFGRSASKSSVIPLFKLGTGGGGDSWVSTTNNDRLSVNFGGQSGPNYEASIFVGSTFPGDGGTGPATLAPGGAIVIRVPSGLEWRGTVVMGASWDEARMTLTQRGGKHDGQTWTLRLRTYS